MGREIDRRDFSQNKVTPAREAELHSRAFDVSDRLPGEHRVRIIRFDATTGNPAIVASEATPAEKGNYIQRALEHVSRISSALGFTETQPREFVADPNPQFTSSGAVAVHLQQQYKGIPIFQATETVRFSPDGALKETVGSSVTVEAEVDLKPQLSVEEAVRIAAQHVAAPHPDEEGAVDQFGEPLLMPSVNVRRFRPKIMAAFTDRPNRPTVLAAGPFGDEIRASLIWFPIENELRLAWEVLLTMPEYAGQYRTMVDTETGEILYCHQLVSYVTAQGNVYRVDGGGTRQMTSFPRPLADYGPPVPGGLPAGFPVTWVEKDRTLGNCTSAHLGDKGATCTGMVQNQVLTFNPANATGDDQRVLNAFYYCCYMHDYFYLLGFREADGNLQHDNFNLGGSPSDRVDVRVCAGHTEGTASMATPVDGTTPIIHMGLATSTNRHTALDSSVVFHEYTHGVNSRLVGGPMNDKSLLAPQSQGMDEGWSDYISCTINRTPVTGAWVVNNPNGIRNFPYDSNYPHHFGDLGKFVGIIDYSERHNMGEIWCAALMEMSRNIGTKLGVQLVVDALKLTPANPSFLDGRDAILAAIEDMRSTNRLEYNEYMAARNGTWQAFARFGMGPGARSNGAQLSGIVADFHAELETVPEIINEALFGKMV